MNKKNKIILSGGATGGSVIPLLQIDQELLVRMVECTLSSDHRDDRVGSRTVGVPT